MPFFTSTHMRTYTNKDSRTHAGRIYLVRHRYMDASLICTVKYARDSPQTMSIRLMPLLTRSLESVRTRTPGRREFSTSDMPSHPYPGSFQRVDRYPLLYHSGSAAGKIKGDTGRIILANCALGLRPARGGESRFMMGTKNPGHRQLEQSRRPCRWPRNGGSCKHFGPASGMLCHIRPWRLGTVRKRTRATFATQLEPSRDHR